MGRPLGSKNRVQRPPNGRPVGRPPGRPRRYSNSTVASVDLEHVKYMPEADVFKPQQSLESNDWPQFELSDAAVYRKKKNGQLERANACNVDLEGPFIIRGKLNVDLKDPEARSLRSSAHRTAYVEIPSSAMYSIGWVSETEEAVVWSAGRSGWFMIVDSAPEYRAMYDTVSEGITIYYLLMDIYTDAKYRAGKGKRAKALLMPVEQLLRQYAVRLGDGITLSEAKDRCQRHAPFLLAHFIFNRDEEFDWKATSFYKWMAETNPRISQKLGDAEKTRGKVPEQTASMRQQSHQAASAEPKAELEDNAQLLLRMNPTESDRSRRTRERATRLSQESDVEMKDAPPAQAPTRVETPILPPPIPFRTAPAPAVVASPATPTGRNIYEDPEMPSDPLQSFLDLLEEIWDEVNGDVSKLTPGRIHTRTYIKCSTRYGASKEVSHFYAKQLVASLPSKWRATPFFEYLLEERDRPWNPTMLTLDTVAAQLKRRKKTVQSKSRNRDSDGGTSTPHIGKRLPETPRTGALTLKRPRPAYYENDFEDNDQPAKYARTLGSSDEENSDEEQVNDSSDVAVARAYPYSTTPIPIPRIARETVPIVVRAENIPTSSPDGPNGTWRCEEDGCGHIVRSAEEQEGKLLIQEHFQDHANRVEKVNLALAEGTRGNLPINHLLEKIRTLGEAARKKEQGADGTFPEPVKRRLIL